MFESIEIKNFQRHKAMRIEFDPHITTIVGSTDAGKSSIYRAIKWSCLNVPSGDTFIRHGRKTTKIKLCFDKMKLIRRRSTSSSFTPFTFEGNHYKAVGKSKMPAEVSNVLCVSTINFQGQFDPPFWFSESGGKVSQELNSIVDLTIIDTSLQSAAQRVRQEKAKYDTLKELRMDAKKRKASLSWIVDAEEEWQTIEKIYEEKKSKENELNVLNETCQKIRAHQANRRQLTISIESIKIVIDIGKELLIKLEKINQLNSLLGRIHNTTKRRTQLVNQLEAVNETLSKVKVCQTCQRPM